MLSDPKDSRIRHASYSEYPTTVRPLTHFMNQCCRHSILFILLTVWGGYTYVHYSKGCRK